MKIEHIAFVVQDPAAMAAWYAEHLGFTIKRALDVSPFIHFLADDAGTMLEIYRQPHIRTPDYREADPLVLHIAFVSEDVQADRARLMSAGAVPVGEISETEAGDQLAMLRDPWGFAIQLAKRSVPMT
ncbi:MAG: hypothetical protein Tsb009_13660 [Planctomycetaceae bacterium]